MNDSLPTTPLILSIIHTSQTPKGIITTLPSASQGRRGMAAWTVQTRTTETRVSWRTRPRTTWCCQRRTCPTSLPTRAPLAPPITIRTSISHWKPHCLPLPRLMWLFLHLSTSTHKTIKVLFMCEHLKIFKKKKFNAVKWWFIKRAHSESYTLIQFIQPRELNVEHKSMKRLV